MSQTISEELSSEQIKKIKEYQEKRTAFIKEQLPALREEAEYEELLFKIENFNYNKEVVRVRLAELKAPSEPDKTPEKK